MKEHRGDGQQRKGRQRKWAGDTEWEVRVNAVTDDLRFDAIRREVLRLLTGAVLKDGSGQETGGEDGCAGGDLRPGVNR